MSTNSAKRTVGPKIEVPSSREDHLRMGRVGLIAAIGFAVGIAWPTLAGLRLAPNLPEEKIAVAGVAAAKPKPPPPSAPSNPPAGSKGVKPEGAVRIGDFQVTSCRNADGDNLRDCGRLDLRAVLDARLSALGTCEAAQGIEGVLSLGLDLDLLAGGVVGVKTGKSTTLPSSTARRLVDCARSQLSSVSLNGVQHEHAQYTVFYLLSFAPPRVQSPGAGPSTPGPADDQIVQASGRATVGWPVALVREAPSTGAVVTRLLSGTRVVVTGRKGDWCRVQYDAKGSEGWVFRTAIGL